MKRPFAEFFGRRGAPEISLSEERGIRYLHFGSVWIQGAMRMSDPWRLELEYTRELFAGLLFQPTPKVFTLVGLGAASCTKFAWKQFPRARVTTVELDPAVIACAHANFALPPDSTRMRVVCGDGEAYLGAHPQSCDYLIVDAYDAAAKGPVLSSPSFYADCRNALATDRVAVLAVNLFGKHRLYNTCIANLDRAFDGRMLVLPASERGNVIAFGFAGPEVETPLAELRARALALKSTTGLQFQKFLAGFRNANQLPGETLRF
jgi:spermidine synthase